MPLMVRVSTQPLEEEGEKASDILTSQPSVTRQVAVLNTSDNLLNLTVMAMDAATHQTTLAQVLVPPHGQGHVGTESGLRLEPGSAVTLRSSGYQEITTTVP